MNRGSHLFQVHHSTLATDRKIVEKVATLLLPPSKADPILLGEHYHFPAKPKIALYFQIHHLTIRADKKMVESVATLLDNAKSLSKQDLSNLIQSVNAPAFPYLEVLIDCAQSNFGFYNPPEVDKNVLRRFGWNV